MTGPFKIRYGVKKNADKFMAKIYFDFYSSQSRRFKLKIIFLHDDRSYHSASRSTLTKMFSKTLN